MKKLAIFDLDGTLISSLDDLTLSINEALSYYSLPNISKLQCQHAIGDGARMLLKRVLKLVNFTPESESEFELMLDKYNSIYGASPKSNTVPFDGIMDMLSNLKTMGYTIGVVSNKPDVFTKEISKNLFGDFLDFAYGQKDGFPKKPDPYLVNLVIKEQGFKKSDSVYIGDSDIDVITAKNAEITSIAVSWGYRSRELLIENAPCYIADSVSELTDIFDKLSK
ncbi:MAG: HAD family hydrolase [Proteocatella sp.]